MTYPLQGKVVDQIARFEMTSDPSQGLQRCAERGDQPADMINISVLAIIHHNQSGATDPLQVVMASKAFPAVARSVHTVGPDPDDEASNRRLFGRPKTILVVLIFLHLAS